MALAEAVGSPLDVVPTSDVDAAFRADSTDNSTPDIATLVEPLIGALLRLQSTLTREIEEFNAIGVRLAADERSQLDAFARARAICERLIWLAAVRRSAYIPIVLLNDALTPSSDAAPPKPAYALIRNEVRARSTDHDRTGLLRRLRGEIKDAVMGRGEEGIAWPIVHETNSYHMLIEPCRGVDLGVDHDALVAKNFSDERFQEDHDGDVGAAFSLRSIHVRRSGDQIRRYEPTEPRDALITMVRYREARGVHLLFLIALVLALGVSFIGAAVIMTAPAPAPLEESSSPGPGELFDPPAEANASFVEGVATIATPVTNASEARQALQLVTGSLPLGVMFSGTLAAFLAFVIQSQERPFSEKILPARIGLLATIPIMAAALALAIRAFAR